jgi:polyphosphate kinase
MIAGPYANRELGILAFNRRVLEQARDTSLPLLERLKFLAISCTNLDEFFEIRVSRLKQQITYGVSAARPEGLAASTILRLVSDAAHALVAEQYRVLEDELLPALTEAGIRVLSPEEWSPAQREAAHAAFQRDVLPVLTPIGIDPAHPFPTLVNKNLALCVKVDGPDAFGRRSGVAVVQVPRVVPRILALPTARPGVRDFALLSAVIETWIGELFPGMRVETCFAFRLTRDADLWLAEEETDDLLQAMRSELARRDAAGDAVRLEVDPDCTDELARFLMAHCELGEVDLYRVPEPVNLHRLAALYDLADRPDLRFTPHTPRLPIGLDGPLFERLRQGDVLLHHPYEAGTPVLELLRQAAADPDVLAVKQTLYRTGRHSPFVAALVDAARAGKEVTAVIELRARFDEAANIELATSLRAAGAHVVYGVVGFKTHAKALLVVRRERDGLRRYVHLGTGNYHPGTARAYTDIDLLTADPELGADVHALFLELTGLGAARPMRHLVQSPFSMRDTLLGLLQAEIEQAQAGQPARVVAKMNALTDATLIEALCRAGMAGVQIDLIVRGVCCLRPGVPGISENIRVRSLIGRFLEHARVWWFHAAGSQKVYAASADWMERSFDRRVEVAFPIRDPLLKQRLITECLEGGLRDDAQTWQMRPDAGYDPPTRQTGFSLQARLLADAG